MITNAVQLKAKIQNLSGGDSDKALVLIRNYMMERLLERIAESEFHDNFILKGGMLVSSMVGFDTRSSMDIDTTIEALPLSREKATEIIEKIISIKLGDNVVFRITKILDIMEEHDYSGLRFVIEGNLDKLKQTIKVDISTGDVITPAAIEYSFPLMLEERTIDIYTYNVETLLAEKIETIIARGEANTRMRDFYDLYILTKDKNNINKKTLVLALEATSRKRNSIELLQDAKQIMEDIEKSEILKKHWDRYMEDSFFIDNLCWQDVIKCDVTYIISLINLMNN